MASPVLTSKVEDLIFDVGMHKGEDTEFYLRKGFRVVAFEADPDLVVFCKAKLNEFIDRGQLTIVEGAIVPLSEEGLRQETVKFYKNSDVSVWGTVCPDWADRNVQKGTSSSVIEVPAIDFASELKKHGIPHYMKIDIEGCDIVCLNALQGFKERPSYISIESDKKSFKNCTREIDLFSELGYTYFQAIEQFMIPQSQSPPFPAREGEYINQHFQAGCSGLFGSELNGSWKPRNEILRQYRLIHIGYFLLGDNGVMKKWRFPGLGMVQSLTRRVVGLLTHGAVPGWYDTHARHSSAT